MTEKLVRYAALLVSFYLLVALFRDAWLSVFSPWPHRIGEGMMSWMASELASGRMPYGDIMAIPSAYACYGPMPSMLAAVLAMLPPGSPRPEYFVWAGRIMVFAAWCAASLSVVAIVRPRSVHPAVAGCVFLCVVSPFWSFWTFRTDAFVGLIEALLLLSMVRLSGLPLVWAISVLAPALALTKIPAAVDVVPLVILAACLRQSSVMGEIRRQAPALAAGAATSLAAILASNVPSGGWMLDNIVFAQLSSGRTTADIFYGCVDFALYRPHAALLWLGVVAACFARRRLSLVALSVSLLATGALATKDGADYNYYLPFLFLATVVSVRELDRKGMLAWAALLLPLTTLPLGGSLHRAPEGEIIGKTAGYERVLDIHRDPNLLSDDPYYSLMAGSRPLATDLFQLSRVMASRGISAAPLVESASGAWGDEFIWTLIGRELGPGSAFGDHLPHANYQGAVYVRDTAPLVPDAPPSIPRHESLVPLYIRLLCIPAFMMLLAASLPHSRRSGVPPDSCRPRA